MDWKKIALLWIVVLLLVLPVRAETAVRLDNGKAMWLEQSVTATVEEEITVEEGQIGEKEKDLNRDEDIDNRIFQKYCLKATSDIKEVYLTIDDGPHPVTTPAYLRILAEKGVKATFFVLGSLAEKYPELVRQIEYEGHAVGNHTYSHNYRHIYASPEDYVSELARTGEVLKMTLGHDSCVTRAPGGTMGHFTLDYYRMLEDWGYLTYDWNIDTQDALIRNISASQIMDNIKRQTPGKKTAVVLLHDLGKKEDILALPQVIDYYRENGYEFCIITEDSPKIIHRTKALQNLHEKFLQEK